MNVYTLFARMLLIAFVVLTAYAVLTATGCCLPPATQAAAGSAGALGVLIGLRDSGVITDAQFKELAEALNTNNWGPAITTGSASLIALLVQAMRGKKAIANAKDTAVQEVMKLRGPTHEMREAQARHAQAAAKTV